MKKLISLLIFVPVGIVLIILSVANRHDVTLSLDPFNPDSPAISATLPFFVFLFAAIVVGMILGSCATWFKQGKHRKAAKKSGGEAKKFQQQCEKLQQQLMQETPKTESGLPILTDRNAA